jgi:hypothetical protein
MNDENFEIHSIELCYGNEERRVIERVAVDEGSEEQPGAGPMLRINVEEEGERGELQDTLTIPMTDWLQRMASLFILHSKNQRTVDPAMYDALKSINEDADSPFKGMIDIPDEASIIFKRNSND